MKVADLETQLEIFYNLINQVEIDYHIYFGLKSIQKKLDHIESIFDHFTVHPQTQLISFNEDSDLPQEIRDVILQKYQEVFD